MVTEVTFVTALQKDMIMHGKENCQTWSILISLQKSILLVK